MLLMTIQRLNETFYNAQMPLQVWLPTAWIGAARQLAVQADVVDGIRGRLAAPLCLRVYVLHYLQTQRQEDRCPVRALVHQAQCWSNPRP